MMEMYTAFMSVMERLIFTKVRRSSCRPKPRHDPRVHFPRLFMRFQMRFYCFDRLWCTTVFAETKLRTTPSTVSLICENFDKITRENIFFTTCKKVNVLELVRKNFDAWMLKLLALLNKTYIELKKLHSFFTTFLEIRIRSDNVWKKLATICDSGSDYVRMIVYLIRV